MINETATISRVIVSSQVLHDRLSDLKGLIQKNPIVPILTNFLVTLDADVLSFTASDLMIFMTVGVRCETASDSLSICVPAKLLLDLTSKLPEQPITMVFDEEELRLQILTDSGEYDIPCFNDTDWPENKDASTPSHAFDVNSDNLKHAMAHTVFACAPDHTKPAMRCIYMEGGPILSFVATDGHRIVKTVHEDQNFADEPFNILVPSKTAELLVKVLPETTPIQVEICKETVFFSWDTNQIESRLIEDDFPSYYKIYNDAEQNPYILTADKSTLVNALKTLALFSERLQPTVRFDLKGNSMSLTAEDSSMEKHGREKILVDYNAEPMAISFNISLLLSMVEMVDTNGVELTLIAPNKAMMIRPILGEKQASYAAGLLMPQTITYGTQPEEPPIPEAAKQLKKNLKKLKDDGYTVSVKGPGEDKWKDIN